MAKKKPRNPVPPKPILTAEQAEAETAKKRPPVAPGPPAFTPEQLRPRDESGRSLEAFVNCRCRKCRHRFDIGPFTRETPARLDDQYQCPKSGCEAINPLYQLMFNAKRERDFFGQVVTCKTVVDRKTKERCGEVYKDKMPGPGAHDAATDTGGLFRCCPRCGTVPPRAVATATGIDMEDADAPQIPVSKIARDS